MQGQSSSAECTVTGSATSGPGRYKCANCSRVFNSSRACSGHQIAHRKAREMGDKAYGPVLAAVLIHHIPSDDEEEEQPAEENHEGTGSSLNPLKDAIQTESNEKENNESVMNKRKNKAVESANPTQAKTGSSQRRPNKKVVRDRKSDRQQPHTQPQRQLQPQKQAQPQPPAPLEPELWTKDFLGEWKSICHVTNGVVTSKRFPEKNPLNPSARFFREETGDDLDLELHLCSRSIEKVDLELKLGF